jgi:hypothetical protein
MDRVNDARRDDGRYLCITSCQRAVQGDALELLFNQADVGTKAKFLKVKVDVLITGEPELGHGSTKGNQARRGLGILRRGWLGGCQRNRERLQMQSNICRSC